MQHDEVNMLNIEKEIIEESLRRAVGDLEPMNTAWSSPHRENTVAPTDAGRHADGGAPSAIGINIDRLRGLAENRAFRHIYSCRRIIGPLIVFGKRVVRKLLKWYLEPVCDQQTDYNRIAAEIFDSLAGKLAQSDQACGELAERVSELEETVQKLQARLSELEPLLRQKETSLEK